MGQHSSLASYSHACSSRYHINLDLTSQQWDELHMPLPVLQFFSFTESQSTDFISSSLLTNPPSTSTEVSTSNAEGQSDVWKYLKKIINGVRKVVCKFCPVFLMIFQQLWNRRTKEAH